MSNQLQKMFRCQQGQNDILSKFFVVQCTLHLFLIHGMRFMFSQKKLVTKCNNLIGFYKIPL